MYRISSFDTFRLLKSQNKSDMESSQSARYGPMLYVPMIARTHTVQCVSPTGSSILTFDPSQNRVFPWRSPPEVPYPCIFWGTASQWTYSLRTAIFLANTQLVMPTCTLGSMITIWERKWWTHSLSTRMATLLTTRHHTSQEMCSRCAKCAQEMCLVICAAGNYFYTHIQQHSPLGINKQSD